MISYYESLFPYEWVEWFLTCGGTFPLNKREFAFRWTGDIAKRNEAFKTIEDAKFYMERNGYDMTEPPGISLPLRFGSMDALRTFLLVKKPHCIDVGPMYQSVTYQSVDSRDSYAPRLAPLTFDIDLKGYKGACLCYTFASVCDACWLTHLRPALIDLVHFLRDTMQFKCIIPVFSGRAGFHVYVLDMRVWDWDDKARSVLIEHLPKSVVRDAAVTLNHLIKLPFSPHLNGQLSFPILNIYEFLPSKDMVKLVNVTEELIDILQL